MTRIPYAALVLAAAPALAASPSISVLEARASVPAEFDGCLDHTVRELGMSAKQKPGERAWVIGPQFLHPSVTEGGTVGVRIEKGDARTEVIVTATWPGAAKPEKVQAELEERVVSMASLMAMVCGAPPRSAICTLSDEAQQATACKHAP